GQGHHLGADVADGLERLGGRAGLAGRGSQLAPDDGRCSGRGEERVVEPGLDGGEAIGGVGQDLERVALEQRLDVELGAGLAQVAPSGLGLRLDAQRRPRGPRRPEHGDHEEGAPAQPPAVRRHERPVPVRRRGRLGGVVAQAEAVRRRRETAIAPVPTATAPAPSATRPTTSEPVTGRPSCRLIWAPSTSVGAPGSRDSRSGDSPPACWSCAEATPPTPRMLTTARADAARALRPKVREVMEVVTGVPAIRNSGTTVVPAGGEYASGSRSVLGKTPKVTHRG